MRKKVTCLDMELLFARYVSSGRNQSIYFKDLILVFNLAFQTSKWLLGSLFWKGIKQLHANFIYCCLAQLILGKCHIVSLSLETSSNATSYRRSLEKFISLFFFYIFFVFFTQDVSQLTKCMSERFFNENIPNISPFAD